MSGFVTKRVSAVVLPLLVCLLAGCGVLDLSEAAKPKNVLSDEQVGAALLTKADIGKGFKRDKGKKNEDEAQPDFGCLDVLESEGAGIGSYVDMHREIAFKSGSETGLPAVFHAVDSVGVSAEKVADDMKGLNLLLRGCTKIDTTDKQGFRLRMTVSRGTKKAAKVVDQQTNFAAHGTMSKGTFQVPMAIYFTVMRIENNTSVLGVVDLSSGSKHPLMTRLAKRAAKKLAKAMTS